jgi:hypothetical protein
MAIFAVKNSVDRNRVGEVAGTMGSRSAVNQLRSNLILATEDIAGKIGINHTSRAGIEYMDLDKSMEFIACHE